MKFIILGLLMLGAISAHACDDLVGRYQCEGEEAIIEREDGFFTNYYYTFEESEYAPTIGKLRKKGSCENGVLKFSKRFYVLGFDPLKINITFSKDRNNQVIMTHKAASLFQGSFPEHSEVCTRL